MKIQKTIIIPVEAAGQRLDKFLADTLSQMSRTKIHHFIEQGAVSVDGNIKKPGFYLKSGQVLRIDIEEEKPPQLEPYDFPVKIIHEDNDIIVVDKPGGLVVHPPQKGYNKTLVNALIFLKKELSSVDPLRPGVVHRLDKETSGVMILAKNNQAHYRLIEQFRQREVNKEYRAIVWGIFHKQNMNIDLPVTRDKSNRLKMKVSFLNAKNAYTQISILRNFKDSSYLSIRIRTGRMHQIRVHLSFLDYPVIGDTKYGKKDGFREMFLHSYILGINHPLNDNFLEFVSPLPAYFENFIKERECLQ